MVFGAVGFSGAHFLTLGECVKQDKSGRRRYAYENHEHDGVTFPDPPEGKFWSNQGWVEVPGLGVDDDEFFRRGQWWGYPYTYMYYSPAGGGSSSTYVGMKKTVDSLPREKIKYRKYYSIDSTRKGGFSNPNSFGSKNGFAFRLVYGLMNVTNGSYIDHKFYCVPTDDPYAKLGSGAEGFSFNYTLDTGAFTIKLWRETAPYEEYQFTTPMVDDHVYGIEAWGLGGKYGFRVINATLGDSDVYETDTGPFMPWMRIRSP